MGFIKRKLEPRETLGDYGMIAKLLAHTTVNSALINPSVTSSEPQEVEISEIADYSSSHLSNIQETTEKDTDFIDAEFEQEAIADEGEITLIQVEENAGSEVLPLPFEESEYLKEEYYPEREINIDEPKQKLLLLTPFPHRAISF